MDMRRMSLDRLASACREETEKFRRREAFSETFCFELIRRAVCERDQTAWEAVLTQYRSAVLAWIRRHPAWAPMDEDDDYWVNRTFERFWRAVGPERFGLFRDLPALLSYLKMCAHSALLDEVRARGAAQVEPLAELRAEAGDGPDVEALAVGNLASRNLWRIVSRELQDDSERLVVYLSFVLGLKPQEVQEHHPDHYPTVADVYRIKRNVLDRLRRSREVRGFLE